MAYVVCSTTAARRYFDYYVHEKGDAAGGRNVLAMVIPNAQSAQYDAMIDNVIAGYGALPLIGTPEQVADGIVRIALVGIDCLTLWWVDYDAGIKQYRDEVRPLLIQSDIRNS
jgi:dimethylsulfone monooxygenase